MNSISISVYPWEMYRLGTNYIKEDMFIMAGVVGIPHVFHTN